MYLSTVKLLRDWLKGVCGNLKTKVLKKRDLSQLFLKALIIQVLLKGLKIKKKNIEAALYFHIKEKQIKTFFKMSEDQNIFELPSSNKDKVVSSDDLDFFLNWNAQDLHSQYEKICDEIERNWKFPTAPIFNLIKHKVRLEHELGLYQESALTMLQSQGLSFRHQALNQYYKRLEIQKSSKNSEKNNQDTDLTEMHQKLLEFQDSLSKNSESVLELIKELPDDWRVIQLSVNDLHSDSRFNIFQISSVLSVLT